MAGGKILVETHKPSKLENGMNNTVKVELKLPRKILVIKISCSK